MKNVAILFIGLGKYSLYYNRFYKSVQKNFLPEIKKHFFIFSDEDFLVENDDETHVKTESFDSARDVKLHKFHFIKSAWSDIKKYDHVFYFDADNVVRSEINPEDIFDSDKPLIGVVHPWGSIRNSKNKFEQDPKSGAFIKKEDIDIPYHQSCFWGGRTAEIEEMVNDCYKTLEKDIQSGHKNENNICDEVHVNRYFALNSENLHSLDRDYANPAEAYQSERRLNKKAFGDNILISHDNANQTYKHSLGLLEGQSQLKNNFCFAGWAQVKDNPKATFEMLKMFKSVNPNAHVHITNSGDENYSEICEAFDCTMNRDESIKGWTSGNRVVEYDIWKWLQNLKQVCSIYLKKYDWLVILEDDVESFMQPMDEPSYSLAGPNGPVLPKELYELIQKKFPNQKISKKYSGCGGSLLNIKAFLGAMEQIREKDWRRFCEIDESLVKYADISLSFVLLYTGFTVGKWDEFCGWTDARKETKAFAHGNKQYYGKELENNDFDYLDYIKYSQIFINAHAHAKKRAKEFCPIEPIDSIAHHSFFKYLIDPEGTCIDVGCRNFIFTNGIEKLCSRVIAIDPGKDIEAPENKNIIFLNQSLTTSDSPNAYLIGQGRLSAYYTSLEDVGKGCVEIPNMSLSNLMKIFKLEDVELIKLDCEGSEYSILNWLSKNPIAKQISVSFHDNLGRNPYKDELIYYQDVFEQLKENYYTIKHAPSSRDSRSLNYEDSLLVRK